jgi:tetrapyrrole methylase family protein/MazG family protein
VAGRIVVVGLGPAGPELVTTGTLERLRRAGRVILRTSRHPAAQVVDQIVGLGDARRSFDHVSSFDHVYEEEASLDAVYERIVSELVAAAGRLGASPETDDVVFVVPGSPMVAERTV